MENDYVLSLELIVFLNEQDILYLSQVRNYGGCCFSDECWFSIEDLETKGIWALEWTMFMNLLYSVGTRLFVEEYGLIWAFNKDFGKVFFFCK